MRKGSIRLGNELWRVLREFYKIRIYKYEQINYEQYERELYFALDDLNWNFILACTVHIII